MAERIFVDAAALVASVYPSVSGFAEATELWKLIAFNKNQYSLITSDMALCTAFTTLRREVSLAHSVLAGELERSALVTRIQPVASDYARAWKHVKNRGWEGFTFTDALHFAMLERAEVRLVFTANRLYARAGFRIFTG